MKSRNCIATSKFARPLENSFPIISNVETAFKEDTLSHLNDLHDLKLVEQASRMIYTLADLYRREIPKIHSKSKLSENLYISFGTCQTIIKNDLHLKRSAANFVPHLLTNEQKKHRKETCKNMVEMFHSDPHWLKIVITGDETWVYGYDPETNRQSSQWPEPGEPRFKKARMIKSRLKCLLIAFFDVKRLIQYEFVPEGQTINQHYYLDVLRRLREAPPYYPELAPNDFFHYPKIKKSLKRTRRFDSIPIIKENTKNILKSLRDEDFQRCFDIWKKRWNKYIDSDACEVRTKISNMITSDLRNNRASAIKGETRIVKRLRNRKDIATYASSWEKRSNQTNWKETTVQRHIKPKVDFTELIKKSVSKKIKALPSLDNKLKNYFIEKSPESPFIRGVPKTHKEGIPLRPVIIGKRSPTREIADWIKQIN
ncbi:hypothetical protein LAZ67_2003626 [Cordylochernes scorpioides]|uniref:Uncharacterized protein n=1 Tax=Cordylochernes scorpioides TaxID=51811 RepID=A0ABY6K6C6_9ARAC|nr:hypothetical protein LAZ67_2003626 [Cordylochernes scorpioides]